MWQSSKVQIQRWRAWFMVFRGLVACDSGYRHGADMGVGQLCVGEDRWMQLLYGTGDEGKMISSVDELLLDRHHSCEFDGHVVRERF